MKKLLTLLFIPAIALADPSVSSDSGRSLDNSESSSINRDKSLSVERSRGDKHSDSDSRERSKERSISRSNSKKLSESSDVSRAGGEELNVNTVLLSEFVGRYERTPRKSTPGKVFFACKPLSGIITEYPTLNSATALAQATDGGISAFDPNYIVPRRLATHFTAGSGGQWGFSTDHTAVQLIYDMPAAHQQVGQYARCRILASKWLSAAAENLNIQSAQSENEVRQRIQKTFADMENYENIFTQMRLETLQLWKSAECAPTLQRWGEFTKPNLICQGVIEIIGDSIIVQNQPTLSVNSIAGRSYKIALGGSESVSAGSDITSSSEARQSRSERSGDSNDRYRDRKKTAGISKSKSADESSSSKTDRSSGNSMTAAPGK